MAVRVVLAIVVAFAVGVLTSFAQGVLPHPLAPLANSAGSWCAVALVLALLVRRSLGAAVTVGGLALVALVAGYYVASHLRGFGVNLTTVGFWVVAGLTVGPALGLAAAWLGRARPRGTYAELALPVLLVAEGVRSLLSVADTTGSAYWIGEIVVGVLLLPVLAVFALREARGPRAPGGNT